MHRRTARLAIACSTGPLALAIAGCYEKVTRADGFGSSQVQVEQGNLRDGPAARALYGERRSTRSDRRPGTDRNDR